MGKRSGLAAIAAERATERVEPGDVVRAEHETVAAPPSSHRNQTRAGSRAGASSLGAIGQYALTAELGRGGMGVVYRAYDRVLKRTVALKMILDPTRAGGELVHRFGTEARAVARLHDPRIVSVFEVGEHEGKPFFVMELVEGVSFEKYLWGPTVSGRKIAGIVREIALALQHAHENGIIHRDVKPENVVVDRAGHAHLMDFGLAQDVGATARVTVTGEILGTPAYMSPEQASGNMANVGPAADIYSLGAVLYRALVGRPPFQAAELRDMIFKLLNEEPRAPRSIDPKIHPDLETIALRCLTREPAGRYASAAEVAAELQRFVDGEPIVARPVSSVERLWRRVRRNRRPVTVGTAAAIVVGLGLAWLQARHRSELERTNEDLRRAQESVRAEELDRVRRRKELERTNEELRVAQATARSEEAEKLSAQSKFDLAIESATRGIDLDPTRAELWGQRAAARFANGDLDLALKDANRALELDPKLVRAWYVRAGARSNRHDLAGAIEDATRAIDLDRTFAPGWHVRAAARFNSGDRDGAIEDATRELALDPRSSEGWVVRAMARSDKGDTDGAIADATEAIRQAPSYAHAWETRAVAKVNKGDIDGAIEDATETIRLDPKLAQAWLVRSLARQRKGDDDGAVEDATETIRLEPHCAQGWLVRAHSRETLDDRTAAMGDYGRFLELAPEGPNADGARTSIAELRAAH